VFSTEAIIYSYTIQGGKFVISVSTQDENGSIIYLKDGEAQKIFEKKQGAIMDPYLSKDGGSLFYRLVDDTDDINSAGNIYSTIFKGKISEQKLFQAAQLISVGG
jgi:hypothetical protein